MDAGAFSDDRVVNAAKKLIPIIISQDGNLNSKYKVKSYPTVIFTDPDGKVVGGLRDRSTGGVLSQIEEMAGKYKGKSPVEMGIGSEKIYKAIQIAISEGKFLMLLFKNNKDASEKTRGALNDETLKDIMDKGILKEFDFEKTSPEVMALHITAVPTIVILNPYLYSPVKKPLATLTGKQEVKSLKATLDTSYKEFEESMAKNKEGEDALNKALGIGDIKTKEKEIKDVINKFKGFVVEERAKEELDKLKGK